MASSGAATGGAKCNVVILAVHVDGPDWCLGLDKVPPGAQIVTTTAVGRVVQRTPCAVFRS